jgi:hypothetical protein
MLSWFFQEEKDEDILPPIELDDSISKKEQEYNTTKSQRIKYEERVIRLKNKEEVLLSELNRLKSQKMMSKQIEKIVPQQVVSPRVLSKERKRPVKRPQIEREEEEYEEEEEYKDEEEIPKSRRKPTAPVRRKTRYDDEEEYKEEEEYEVTPKKKPAVVSKKPARKSQPMVVEPEPEPEPQPLKKPTSAPRQKLESHDQCFDQECCAKQNDYIIEKQIGFGHFTLAFIAKNKSSGKRVLLKRIWDQSFDKSKARWTNDIHKYLQLIDLESIPKIIDFWFCKNGTIILRDKRGEPDDGYMRETAVSQFVGKQPTTDFFIVVELVENAMTMFEFEQKFTEIFGGKPDIDQLKGRGYYNGLKNLVYRLAEAEIKHGMFYGDLHPGNFVMNAKTKEWFTVDAGAFWKPKKKTDNFLKFFNVLKPLTRSVNTIQNAIISDLIKERLDFAAYYKKL